MLRCARFPSSATAGGSSRSSCSARLRCGDSGATGRPRSPRSFSAPGRCSGLRSGRRARTCATARPAIMLGTWALQWAAKWTSGRPRPNQAPLGFPSGHVLSLVVLFGLAAYVLCRVSAHGAARRLGICATSTLRVMVAASRLYLDAHWVLDLAGGFLLGLAYLMLLIWITETRESRQPAPAAARVA